MSSAATTMFSNYSSSSSFEQQQQQQHKHRISRSRFTSTTKTSAYANNNNKNKNENKMKIFKRGRDLFRVTATDDSSASFWDAEKMGKLDPIRNEVLLSIVNSELSDEDVNRLVWECLGYRCTIDLDPETLTAQEIWTPDEVFPNWAKKYPQPPDVIGTTRKYYPEIDGPVKEACASLTRSVASEYKNGLKEALKPLGWKGFKMEGLTPNMTRRAQAANWLVYYRSELRGVSIEELKRRREVRRAKELEDGTDEKPTGGTKQSVV